MSNEVYYPIATGTDLPTALALVDRLLNHATAVEIELAIRTDSHKGVRFLTYAHSSLELHAAHEVIDSLGPGVDDGKGGAWLALGLDDTAALAQLAELPAVPADVNIRELAVEQFDPGIIPADEPVMIEWEVDRWPGPAGLPPEAKHAGIALSLNCSGLWNLEPGHGWQLYVVTREGHDEHAALAAAAVGCSVIGPPLGY
jgi:hypothetical protein